MIPLTSAEKTDNILPVGSNKKRINLFIVVFWFLKPQSKTFTNCPAIPYYR